MRKFKDNAIIVIVKTDDLSVSSKNGMMKIPANIATVRFLKVLKRRQEGDVATTENICSQIVFFQSWKYYLKP